MSYKYYLKLYQVIPNRHTEFLIDSRYIMFILRIGNVALRLNLYSEMSNDIIMVRKVQIY